MSVVPFAKRNKFNAVRTEAFGHVFDSKREAKHYGDLLLRERAGLIRDLRRQVKYALYVNGELIANYTADAVFFDVEQNRRRVVDIKSAPTAAKRDFRLICKLMKALHGVEVEVLL